MGTQRRGASRSSRGAGPSPVPRTPELSPSVRRGTYRLFEALSAGRGARIFHPAGAAYEARFRALVPTGVGAGVLADPRERPAVVRFSRGLGVPRPLPDFLGLSMRVPDAYGDGAHQDLLLAAAGRRPPGTFVPRPRSTFFGPAFSSLLPYRIGGELVLVGALAADRPPPGAVEPLAELEAALASGPLRFTVAITRLTGRWTPAGVLEIGARLPDESSAALRFNPWNTGGGVEPAGWPNRLRDPAYRGSQAGRGAGTPR
jgi:hypothetical protein